MLRVPVIATLVAASVFHFSRDPELLKAQDAERGGDPLNALRWSLASLRRRPSGLAAARIAARNLSQLLYPDEAEAYYLKLRSRGVFDVDDAHARALGLTRANRRDSAVLAYKEILSRTPEDAAALQRLAAIHWGSGRGEEALALAERLSRTPAGVVPGLAIMAAVEHASGKRPEAIRHSRALLDVDPELKGLAQSPLIFWVEFGTDLLSEGLPSEARRRLEPVAARLADPGLMDLLAQTYLDEGDRDEAERWWRRSIEREAGRAQPWLQLGRLALQRQTPAEAVDALSRANELRPGDYETLAALAAAHRLLGHAGPAAEFQAEARRAMPKSEGGMGADAPPKP